MKYLIILFTVFLVSCASGSKVTKAKINGICQTPELNLFMINSSLTVDELEAKLKNIYGGSISPTLKTELDELKIESNIGGKIFEVSSDDDSWRGLYGSAGYGLIRNDCIIVYIELVVS